VSQSASLSDGEAVVYRAGWFGGRGCHASVEVTLPVPLGPSRPVAVVPKSPPSSPEEPNDIADDTADPEVEEYIARHGIDELASQALRELPPELQRQVIESGLSNCRNRSAVLLSRIDRVVNAACTGILTDKVKTEPAEPRMRSRSPYRRVKAALDLERAVTAEEASPEAVEDFIALHGLDEKAAQALHELSPQLQTVVIEAGLVNCRNPSAVVHSRIQSLKSTSVEDYIDRLGLDDQVSSELRDMDPAEQMQVIETDPVNARNPSAVVKSRIQLVKGTTHIRQQAEDYLLRHGIDETASQILRALPVDLQRLVVETDLSNCRNPSAVLLSRIRSIEGSAMASGGLQPSMVALRSTPLAKKSVMPVRKQSRLPGPLTRSVSAVRSPLPLSKPALLSTLSATQVGLGVTTTTEERTEEFIFKHNLDDKASEALRDLPLSMRAPIVEADLVNCRNPSAVVTSKIAALKANPVENYIQRHNLDDKVAQQIRCLPAIEQLQVIETDIVNARNPSAVVSSRIQAMRGRESFKSQVESYVIRHAVDEAAAQALRELQPEMQRQIMEKDLSNCRNASAVLLSRIRAVSSGLSV